ncbi:MAG: GIY-YIG nuclease family protein [bacterium]
MRRNRRLREFYVYIMSNNANTVLYTGVTNDLERRVSEQRSRAVPGFAPRYGVRRLVFWEEFNTASEAIAREKQIKGGSRLDKIRLIHSVNPEWKNLAEDWE